MNKVKKSNRLKNIILCGSLCLTTIALFGFIYSLLPKSTSNKQVDTPTIDYTIVDFFLS